MTDTDSFEQKREKIETGVLHGALSFPLLSREERVDLTERLTEGAHINWDYVVMMTLAAALASLGLLQGSTAVVIGAMLVAPLMNPLVAGGLALNQGNASLARRALLTALAGVAIGFAVSCIVGLLNPGYEPSLEIEARGNPDLFDLGIALASGMAGAYAVSRPGVASTLAGVAIAAALVPPLAAVGIALTNAHPVIAGYAAILLATNLVAIVLGASLVFWLLGVRGIREAFERPWARWSFIGLLVAGSLLAGPLVVNLLDKTKEGLSRPLSYPVAPHVRDAANAYIDQRPGVDIMAIARRGTEPHAGVVVMLIADHALDPSLTPTLTKVIRAARGDRSRVQIFPMLRARTEPPE